MCHVGMTAGTTSDWEPPENLGCAGEGGPNSGAYDLTPALLEDEAGRVGNWDHYQSELRDDDTFGPATPVVELNSSYVDQGVTVRRDGLEVFLLSNRGGAHDSMDFWRATRASTEDPWSAPEPVSSLGNPAMAQGKISLSFDGREINFTSWRPGGAPVVPAETLQSQTAPQWVRPGALDTRSDPTRPVPPSRYRTATRFPAPAWIRGLGAGRGTRIPSALAEGWRARTAERAGRSPRPEPG